MRVLRPVRSYTGTGSSATVGALLLMSALVVPAAVVPFSLRFFLQCGMRVSLQVCVCVCE